MNILYITYGLPYPPHSGARLRDWHFIQHLAAHHSVHLLCLLEDTDDVKSVGKLEEQGISVEAFAPNSRTRFDLRSLARHLAARRPLATYAYYDHRMMARIAEIAATKKIEVVQIEHSFLAPYTQALPRELARKSILDLHNIGAMQYRRSASIARGARDRFFFWLKAQAMKNWEARIAANFGGVIVTSDRDAQWLKEAKPHLPITVIENGVDTQASPSLPESESRHLLFVGSMGYAPNVDAMLWFCDEILPRLARRIPDLALTIVGRAPTRDIQALGRRHNVTVTGPVHDLTLHYQRAQIVIAPLRAGGGTRLKILEAMAFGRAVVSTSLGCEGLEVRDGENISIADTPSAFADRVVELLNDRAQREHIAQNARRLVESCYDWRALGDKLLRVYEQIHDATFHSDSHP